MFAGKGKGSNAIRIILIIFGCVFINFVGKHAAEKFTLPLWLDSFGTVFAAYVLGSISGALVGLTGNIIYFFWRENSLAYGLASIFIGIVMGYAARRKQFETFFGAASIAGWVTLVSAVISTVLNIGFYDGSTGNVWGDGVRDFLIERKAPGGLASAAGAMYLDFLDKLVTVLAMYFLIRLYRFYRGKRAEKRESRKAPIIFTVLLCAGLFVPGDFIFAAEEAGHTIISGEEAEHTYIRRVFNADNGLICGHANDVAQTNDGTLWIASYAGLYRYNGTSFRFMEEFTSVKNANCLYVDEEGRLLIGTNDSGLVISINEKVANTLDSLNGLPSDSVEAICQNTEGDYFIGTEAGLAIVRLKTGLSVVKVIDELAGVQCLSADKEGHVAAVTAEGRLYILKDGEIVREIPNESGTSAFSACAFDGEGNFYAGCMDGSVWSFPIDEREQGTGRAYPGTLETRINRICFYEGVPWVLSDNGIGKLEHGQVSKVETGSFQSSVYNMTEDYQGNLWFASARHGLLQLSGSAFSDLFSECGLEVQVVNTTAMKSGDLYAGTDSGLIILDVERKESKENELTDMLSGNRIRCISEDSKGNLWICSYGAGLIRVSEDGGIKRFNASEYGIGNRVRVCIELSNGSIAAGGDNGLAFIKGEEVSMIRYGEMGSSRILCLCELPDKTLLAGTDGNGIIQISDGKVAGRLTRENGLTSGVILRMVSDKNGDIFIVTSNGLCLMDENGIRELEDFPYSNNYDVVLDDDGEMFVLGSAGIYVADKKRLVDGSASHFSLLNSKSGLTAALTANAWNALDNKGNLYMGTDRGVFVINLDAHKQTRQSYRLRLKEMKIDSQTIPIERETSLTIGRETVNIEFFPEVVNFSLNQPEVSYYLEGVDEGYKTVPQGEFSGVVYTNLPAGEYAFHLAIIEEGNRSILEESVYRFVKEDSIHDKGFFPIYMIVVGGLFIGWLTWFLTKVGVQRTIEIQQERLSFALRQVQMGNETILAIAKTVDAKDVLTSRHSERVSEYSALIAGEYGFSEEEQENIRKAALLHDIGKIGIQDAILNKPAPLDDEEYAVMKTHVIKGAEILKDFTLVEHVVDGAKYHHERYDGKGYPDGIKGADIPLYGRIIAVADAFDAMTANRVYRKRLNISHVMEELRKGRGTQFDPELLDIFLKLIEEGHIDMISLYAGNEVDEA